MMWYFIFINWEPVGKIIKKQFHIKKRSNFSLSSSEDSDDSLTKSCTHLAELSSSTTSSSSTFDSYNSIIETNSINKIFEEKFKNSMPPSEAATTKTSSKLVSQAENTTASACTNSSVAQSDAATSSSMTSKHSKSNNELFSVRSSRFKKKFEKLKRLNKLINQNTELAESKLDIVDYNKNSKLHASAPDKSGSFSANKITSNLNLNDNKRAAIGLLRSLMKKNEKEKKRRLKKDFKLKHISRVPIQSIHLSQLQHLSLRNMGVNVIKPAMLNDLLKNFKCLKYLDISNCCTNQLHYSTNNNTKMFNENGNYLSSHRVCCFSWFTWRTFHILIGSHKEKFLAHNQQLISHIHLRF